jgi:DNA polymerase elongation subunit (family B)
MRPRGRPRKADRLSKKGYRDKALSKKTAMRRKNIAILDMETDKFDNRSEAKVLPFLAVLYSDQFEPVIIWDEKIDALVDRIFAAIDDLPEPFTIYAHNGGRFDYMFLIHRLRGDVSFKGRGIMSAKIIGRHATHEIRDSFHIIPERLAAYEKEDFDYAKNDRGKRGKHRQEIIAYCVADCRYLLELVRQFIDGFGLKLSFGQAAMFELCQHYPDIAHLDEGWDAYLRGFFFGGRVECLQGAGEFVGPYKTYDVNSMYSSVMAARLHPIGGFDAYKMETEIGPNTCFVDLDCVNHGALIARDPVTKETTTQIPSGNFLTTIWEYDAALRLGLIENVSINLAIDCTARTDFSKFVLPNYERRKFVKATLREMRDKNQDDTAEYRRIKCDDLFLKFLLNSGYGKFAQNPRNFKEHYLTDPDQQPPKDWFESLDKLPEPERIFYRVPAEECLGYWIWSKPAPGWRFNNVGTAASITGAARAVLMEAIAGAHDPIYCDTDAVICRGLSGVEIHPEKLGAWDLEDEFSVVRIAGKKLYGGQYLKPRAENLHKIRSKGVTGTTWLDLGNLLGSAYSTGIEKRAFAPTLFRTGNQEYLRRVIRVTAPLRNSTLDLPNVR